ncbi:MAG TPA: P-II family nitrogen regulator [Planctomycetota bacterium]|nr:P-II family nitrogen regulator [Planctomycetota bacterium]
MKLVEAIIQPFKLEDVKHALSQIDVKGLTVSEVQGFGRQKGRSMSYRGASSTPQFIPKLKLQVIVTDAQLPQVEEAIRRTARTGNVGDGKIFVISLDQVSRIRTGEKGDAAV